MADGQTFYSNGIRVLRDVRAVFPALDVPDNRFDEPGDYKIAVDVTPEIEARFQEEHANVVAEAKAKHGVTDSPTNVILKKGLNKRKEPFYRLEFKMSAERKSKGKKVPQRPQVVDANKDSLVFTFKEATAFGKPELAGCLKVDLYSGSLVHIGYELQYSITQFGCNVTPKLKAVQLITLVDSTGVAIDDLFGDEDGFSGEDVGSPAEAPTDPTTPTKDEPSAGGIGAGNF